MLNVVLLVLLYTATPARVFFLQKLLPWLECGNICLIRLVLSFAIIFMAFRFVKRVLWTFCKFCSPAILFIKFSQRFCDKNSGCASQNCFRNAVCKDRSAQNSQKQSLACSNCLGILEAKAEINPR